MTQSLFQFNNKIGHKLDLRFLTVYHRRHEVYWPLPLLWSHVLPRRISCPLRIETQLVTYSENDQFNANVYEMAFPLACVAVDLMVQNPGLSKLFLGMLYM